MVFRLLRMTVIGFGILLSLLAVLAAGSIVGECSAHDWSSLDPSTSLLA